MKHKIRFFGLALAAVLLTGCGADTTPATTAAPEIQTQPTQIETTTQPAPADVLEILTLEETGEWVRVETSYCTVQYPYAFSDLMTVSCEAGEEAAHLMFGASLTQEHPLFRLTFGEGEGILLGWATLPVTGETVPVWASLYPLAEELEEPDRITCLAVQECINDVIASLGENGNFIPAE